VSTDSQPVVAVSPRAHRLLERLAASSRRRPGLDELWEAFDAADPASRGAGDRRELLAGALGELIAARLIEPPSQRSYDRSATPALPRHVTLPRAQEPGRIDVNTVPWRPEMSWVLGCRLTPNQLLLCLRVNEWFVRRGGDVDVVPLRERAWEILGDEKGFDAALRTELFGPGRLSLEVLSARLTPPPLAVRSVGDGSVLLVAENAATYDSLVLTLAEHPGEHHIGWVGFGGGEAFAQTVASVPHVAPGCSRIVYFGDLDVRGLAIPAAAREAMRYSSVIPAALPDVEPAIALYRMLLESADHAHAASAVAALRAKELSAWLPVELRTAASSALVRGVRIPQECVGLSQLRADFSWAPTI
jgi:hypothetical protein